MFFFIEGFPYPFIIIDEEMKELREAINIESHIALQLNTLLCKCNVCNAIGNLYIFLTIFKGTKVNKGKEETVMEDY